MKNVDDRILAKLLGTFQEEAEEHLKKITSSLMNLEKGDKNSATPVLEIILRELHSLKGAANTINEARIESICQALESVFIAIKSDKLNLSSNSYDILYKTLSYLEQINQTVANPVKDEREGSKDHLEILNLITRLTSSEISDQGPGHQADHKIRQKLEKARDKTTEKVRLITVAGGNSGNNNDSRNTPQKHVEMPEHSSKTVRIAVSRLLSILLQAEEMRAIGLGIQQRALELRELEELLKSRETEKAVQDRVSRLRKATEGEYRSCRTMLNTLLDDMRKAVMCPCSSLLEIFPKLVRDLSHDLGKKIDVIIEGGDIEIDRRILEEVKDSFIHLLRNAADHGIEPEGIRLKKGKPAIGTIKITVSPKNEDAVEFLIKDDGAGIVPLRVATSAYKTGLISKEQINQINAEQAIQLMFKSGISTAPLITELSGRGLGLAIVQEKIDALGGTIKVETTPDQGTSFRIQLPLSFSTFRGVLVDVADQKFVFPAANIERVYRQKESDIKTVEGKDTIVFENRTISLASLSASLKIPQKKPTVRQGQSFSESNQYFPMVISKVGEKRVAFLVDRIWNDQDILVKKLGPQLKRVRNIAGATILGDGQVVPILNVNDLMVGVSEASSGNIVDNGGGGISDEGTKIKSILVVEDNVTSRTLLKNILESEGYMVKTAKDGLEAFSALRTENFDLVVSDIDMPGMNGLDLTAKIRADKHLSELPVILVTANEARETKEKGIEVGANAYIVKSRFDQTNLLEIIRRLAA